MQRILKISGLIAATLALGAVVVAETNGPATPAALPTINMASLFGDNVVARGKGFEIKQSQIDQEMVMVRADYAGKGRAFPDAQRNEIQAQVLDLMIGTRLLNTQATEADRAKAKEEADKAAAQVKAQLPSEEMLGVQLKAVGLTVEQWRTRLLEQAICKAVLERAALSNVVVTDEQMKKFYDDNPKFFQVPDLVHAAHVLIATHDPNKELTDAQKAEKKRLAESVRDRARKGDDFAKLVKEFSEDARSKDRGGDYTFPRAKDDPEHAMPPDFEAAAFSLGVNEVSEVVASDAGYHVIKVLDKKPAKMRELAEVKEDIKKHLEQLEMNKTAPPYMANLRKEAKVEILDDNLKMPPQPEPAPGLAPAK